MIRSTHDQHKTLTEQEIEIIVEKSVVDWDLQSQKILIIIPDRTRSAPIPFLFELINRKLYHKVRKLDYLIALGTHPPLDKNSIEKLVGLSLIEIRRKWPDLQIYNHLWNSPDHLVEIGRISSELSTIISNGLLSLDIPVRINHKILDYDSIIVCGPVFPHEVVGFSGGNKYFFPGVSSPEMINFTHWLGALMTNETIIGTKNTPVRTAINFAANMIPVKRFCICFVVEQEKINGIFCGTPEEAWSAAADLSAKVHIKYLKKSMNKVLAIIPEMYSDLWVGGKGMYKTEPVIADGGEVILYAPHIHEISSTHGDILMKIGYHVRDYYVKQWDKFAHFPWSVLAHSTHVRGKGTFVDGKEYPRITVSVASRIPKEIIESLNLSYVNPKSISIDEWKGNESQGVLVVPHAGEILYRRQ